MWADEINAPVFRDRQPGAILYSISRVFLEIFISKPENT